RGVAIVEQGHGLSAVSEDAGVFANCWCDPKVDVEPTLADRPSSGRKFRTRIPGNILTIAIAWKRCQTTKPMINSRIKIGLAGRSLPGHSAPVHNCETRQALLFAGASCFPAARDTFGVTSINRIIVCDPTLGHPKCNSQ